MDYLKASVMQSGDVLGKRQQVSPPPTMLIKDHIVSNRAHIFTPKEITPLQLNPDTLKQQQDAQQQKQQQQKEQRHPAVKYTGSGTPKQSPLLQGKSPPKSESSDQQGGDRGGAPEEVKISHEETTQRLRQFIKKRTVNEAFNSSTADKSGVNYQPWVPSVSNLKKATSEPNIRLKARPPRQKLPALNRSATFSSAYSPRKDLHPALRNRAPSMTDEANHNSVQDCSPPFKFPKLESSFFKSLPNVRSMSTTDIADKAKSLISPEDGPLRSHPLLKDASMESLSGSSLTTFYPSLAKLINGDIAERSKDLYRGHDLWKGLRMPEPSVLSSFSPASRPLFPIGSLLNTPPERLDLSSKNILEYAQSQLIQMQQLSQEQEEIKEQQKVLMQQQERILKEQDALRQREVFIRKIFYDASANMAVADHMVSAMIQQNQQSHVVSPLSMSMPDFYSSTKHAEMLLKKAQEQQLANQAEQLLLLQRSAGNLKLNSAFGHYNPGNRNSISSQSAPNVQSLASEMVTDPPPLSGRTGIIYDSIMLKHICTCSNPVVHKESPGRLSSIWARLTETGVANRCARLKSRKATNEELELIHSKEHVCKYGGMRNKVNPEDDKDFIKLKCGGIGKDEQTIWNDLSSAQAARIAAGSVLELATKVAMGELKNAFALVRPPGHMAERSEAKNGCYFNNVAIAAKYLTTQKLSNRVLIVDWDLEHGNGLQQAFYNDPNVLVINIHRYDNATYYPRTGHAQSEGAGDGKGFNINIPFSGSAQTEYGDPEYLAAFRCIIKPVAEQFCPDIVLIAAGYNAMSGHESYNVTAECFAFMTQELGRLAEGRIMIALEGGFNLVSLSQACEMCIRSLLGEQITHLPAKSLKCAPNAFAVKAIEECITIHRKTYQFAPYLNHISLSVYDAVKRDQEEVDTITALASLSMQHPNNFNQAAANNGPSLLQNRTV